MANRLLARSRRRVFLAFPIAGPRGRALRASTGRPVPAGTGDADRAAARERFGVAPDAGPCLLVFGGSLGARTLNERRDRGVRRRGALRGAARVRHSATTTSCARGSTRWARRRTTGSMRTSSRSPTRCAAADLVVARAGGSVFELAAAGLPAMLVPYPHATADHQTAERALDGARAAPRWWCRTASSTGRGSPARSPRCSAPRPRLARMAAAASRISPPGRRGADRRRELAAAGRLIRSGLEGACVSTREASHLRDPPADRDSVRTTRPFRCRHEPIPDRSTAHHARSQARCAGGPAR